MKCIKCKKEIPDGSTFCNFCGKKQVSTIPKTRIRRRPHGTGTIAHDKRYQKPYVAYGPATRHGKGRTYIGTFATKREAQLALEQFCNKGRPELYNATLEKVYELWSAIHFNQVSESAVKLYQSMWKRFDPIAGMRMQDIRTVHFQNIVNTGTSKSACEILRTLANMLSSYAMENDIIQKNYAEFIRIPKFEKKEKRIFSAEEIRLLWEHSNKKNVQIILFMIYTGFRVGEVVTLTADNVHLDEGYIIGGEKTKAGKNRIVPFPSSIPEIKDFVSNWELDAQGNYFSMSINKFREDIFRVGLQECGINDSSLTPHSTRHTFASLSASAGFQPEKLQKIIGHASYSTTANVYIHQDFEQLRQEMQKLKK